MGAEPSHVSVVIEDSVESVCLSVCLMVLFRRGWGGGVIRGGGVSTEPPCNAISARHVLHLYTITLEDQTNFPILNPKYISTQSVWFFLLTGLNNFV